MNNNTKQLMIQRTVSREVLMKYLFQKALLESQWEGLDADLVDFIDGIEDDAMEIYSEYKGEPTVISDIDFKEIVIDKAYLSDLSNAIENHKEEIDEYINKYARNWSIETLPTVDVAILRLAIAEIKFSGLVPEGVACDQAVLLAKKYCDDGAYKYINGILGSVIAE